MTLPVPNIPGSRPMAVAHRSTNSPAGPFIRKVSTTSRTRMVLLSILWRTLSAKRENSFPHPIVIQYPISDATAEASRSITNASLMKPSRPSPTISPMTSAVPDLPFPETDNVTSASTDVTVPIDATVDMNLAGWSSGKTVADIDAPTVAVIPGNQPATVPIRTPLSPGIGPTGSFTRSVCLGRLVPSEDESITGMPNSPVSSGIITVPSPRIPTTGIGRVMHPSPSTPDNRNNAAPHGPLPLPNSPPMRTADATISTMGVMLSNTSPAPFISIHCNGTDSAIAAEHPIRLPMAAARTASIPRPLRRSLWPGRTETASSASGAPMNTEGTKSTNEWTTDAAMMQHPTAMAEDAGSIFSMSSMAGYDARSSAARVFTWIPGTRPLNVPMAQPDTASAMQIAKRVGSMSDPSHDD